MRVELKYLVENQQFFLRKSVEISYHKFAKVKVD